MTGTLINVATVLVGTGVGAAFGSRLPAGLQQRVLAGLALVTLVLGIDNALAWRTGEASTSLCVLGGVLLGGLAGELIGIERRLEALGDRLERRMRGLGGSVSEGFVAASLLFCVGPLTVVGSIEDGLRGDVQLLVTKSLLDGFAAIALASTLGLGVGLSAITVLVVQGTITLAAGLFDSVLSEGSEALAALTSAGGILIIGIALKLADVKDVKVGNFLPALVLAPALVGLVDVVR